VPPDATSLSTGLLPERGLVRDPRMRPCRMQIRRYASCAGQETTVGHPSENRRHSDLLGLVTVIGGGVQLGLLRFEMGSL